MSRYNIMQKKYTYYPHATQYPPQRLVVCYNLDHGQLIFIDEA